MSPRLFACIVMTLIMLCGVRQGQAQTVTDSQLTSQEIWAWSQIVLGKPADLDLYCQSSPPALGPDRGATAPCREIGGATLVRFLTETPWREAIPHAGLRLVGAWVRGDIDLVNAHIGSAVTLARSQVDGSLWLTRARLDGLLALDGSTISGEVHGTGLQAGADISLSDGRWLVPKVQTEHGFHATGPVTLRNSQLSGSLFLNKATFDQDIDLRGVHVGGDVKASGAQINKRLRGGSLRVAGDVDLTDLRAGGDVDLAGLSVAGDLRLVDPEAAAKTLTDVADPCVSIDRHAPAFLADFSLAGASLGGALAMSGVVINGHVSFNNARVNGTMQMAHACFLNDLQMGSLEVSGDLRLGRAHVRGETAAADLHVAHDLDLSDAAFENQVNLFGAQIGDTVHIEQALFLARMGAPGLHVTSDFITKGARFAAEADLSRTKLGGDLDLTGAHFVALDLARADISGALLIDPTTTWDVPAAPLRQFDLTTTHLGTLPDLGGIGERACPTEDSPPGPTGWPTAGMQLDGLTYDHLSETGRQSSVEMPARNVCWWDWWLRQDATFSDQPYLQLAGVMAAHGDQGNASAIAYFGRLRETAIAWNGGHYGRWILLSLFDVTVGYGIGGYSSRVLIWVVVLTVAGGLLLKRAKGGKDHTLLWRLGASMARVLPAIEINREFTEFFYDPNRERLTSLQLAIFSVVAVIGWALGLFIVAAMSGLTQHS